MEAQEFNFKGFKANGFLMLAVHLLLISAAIVLCFIEKRTIVSYTWRSTFSSLAYPVWRIYATGA